MPPLNADNAPGPAVDKTPDSGWRVSGILAALKVIENLIFIAFYGPGGGSVFLLSRNIDISRGLHHNDAWSVYELEFFPRH